jgi:hypothetical protein
MNAEDHKHLEDLRKDAKALREQSNQLILALKQLVHDSKQLRKIPRIFSNILLQQYGGDTHIP